jgi:cbb3-type cytochrome oxidase maturation protein
VTKITPGGDEGHPRRKRIILNLPQNSHEMKIIFLLLIISLIVALGFLGAFLWAVRSGQFDDDYTPSVRILFDDDQPETSSSNENTRKS